MTINESSLAAGVGVGVRNVAQSASVQVLNRKIIIIGLMDDSLINPGLTQVNSPDQVGSLCGFGQPIHRMAMASFEGSNGTVETFISPFDPEPEGGGQPGVGNLLFGSTGTNEGGTIYLYLGGDRIPISLPANSSGSSLATAAETVLNDYRYRDIIADSAVDGVTPEQLNLTTKDHSIRADEHTIKLNIADDEKLPNGVTVAITDFTGGAGINSDPVTELQKVMGNNLADNANDKHFTALIHPWVDDSDIALISNFNGIGDQQVGLYSKIVARPFRSVYADVYSTTDSLDHFTTISDQHKNDRTNGIFAAPGALNHPYEIAAEVVGIMERINKERPAEHYNDIPLTFCTNIDPVVQIGFNWSSYYTSRDSAVQQGISTSLYLNGQYYIQNLVTFYRPDSVAASNNAYRAMSNISKIQNILYNHKLRFDSPKWKGFFIVANKVAVTSLVQRQKARDINDVYSECYDLAKDYAGLGLLFESAYTINRIAEDKLVQLRPAGNGFDMIFPCILSGEGGILNSEVQVDINLSILIS